MDKIQLGLNIKKARQKSGLTQSELAELIKVSNNYISSIECGKKTPKLEKLFKMADVLNVSLDVFAENITSASKQEFIDCIVKNSNAQESSLNENEYKLLKNVVDNLLEYFKNNK